MKKALSPTAIALLAIVACIFWSSAFVGVKTALQYVPPLFLGGTRFMLAGLLLVPLWIILGARVSALKGNWGIVAATSLFQTVLLYALFNWGMTMVSGASGAITIGSSPLFAALAAHLFGKDDKITLRSLVTIALGIGGIGILVLGGKPWSPAGASEALGIAMLATGSFFSALGNIVAAKNRPGLSPALLNSVQMFLGGTVLLLLSLGIEHPVTSMPRAPQFWIAFLWLALLSATAFTLWFHLLRQPGVKVSSLNVWKFIIPISGCIISWTLLPNESPTLAQLTGMIVVASAVVLHRQ